MPVPTPAKLRSIIAEILEGVAGGEAVTWWDKIGEVEKLPVWASVRSNWEIHPVGNPAELDAIQKAAEVVRGAHPYVAN